jgi:hypothetical protein
MLRNSVKDPIVWITVGIGLALMVLTLYWDINPVDGSVVPSGIAGTWIHYLLFVLCMPAWIGGLFLSMIVPLPFQVMVYLCQILLYFLIGLLARRVFKFISGGSSDGDKKD